MLLVIEYGQVNSFLLIFFSFKCTLPTLNKTWFDLIWFDQKITIYHQCYTCSYSMSFPTHTCHKRHCELVRWESLSLSWQHGLYELESSIRVIQRALWNVMVHYGSLRSLFCVMLFRKTANIKVRKSRFTLCRNRKSCVLI